MAAFVLKKESVRLFAHVHADLQALDVRLELISVSKI